MSAILYSAPGCVQCNRVKEYLDANPDLKAMVEIKNAPDCMDEVVKYGIRSVPNLVVNETAHPISTVSNEDIKKLILGEM